MGLIALPFAGCGIIGAGIFIVKEQKHLVIEAWDRFWVNRAIVRDWPLAIAEDKARLQLMFDDMPEIKKPNYRHNVHCTCGKFAKRVVMGGIIVENAVECHQHGVVIRWQDVPIDWAILPVTHIDDVHISIAPTGPIEVMPAMGHIELDETEPEPIKDFTGSIAIVIDDQLALSSL